MTGRRLSSAEAAEALGVSRSTLSYMRRRKQGPPCALTDGGYVYDEDALGKWAMGGADRVSLNEAASRMGISPYKLYGLMRRTDAPRKRFGGTRAYSFAELEGWIALTFGGVEPSSLLGGGDVARRCGISRALVSLCRREGKIPRPAAVIGNRPYWRASDIDEWWARRGGAI